MYQQFMETERKNTQTNKSELLTFFVNDDEEIAVMFDDVQNKEIIAVYPNWYDETPQYINECENITYIESGLLDAIINDRQYEDELNARGIYNLMVYIYKHKEV